MRPFTQPIPPLIPDLYRSSYQSLRVSLRSTLDSELSWIGWILIQGPKTKTHKINTAAAVFINNDPHETQPPARAPLLNDQMEELRPANRQSLPVSVSESSGLAALEPRI